NANWYTLSSTNAALKYQVLRPRPVDHLLANEIWVSPPGPPSPPLPAGLPYGAPYNTVTKTYRTSFFPPPEDAGGDVKNLIGAPSWTTANASGSPVTVNNDSFWMDLGFPVMTSPDGRKFKAMAALHIEDLDNRANLTVHGNVRGWAASLPLSPA